MDDIKRPPGQKKESGSQDKEKNLNSDHQVLKEITDLLRDREGLDINTTGLKKLLSIVQQSISQQKADQNNHLDVLSDLNQVLVQAKESQNALPTCGVCQFSREMIFQTKDRKSYICAECLWRTGGNKIKWQINLEANVKLDVTDHLGKLRQIEVANLEPVHSSRISIKQMGTNQKTSLMTREERKSIKNRKQ